MKFKPSMQSMQSDLVSHETRFGSAHPVGTLNWLRAGIERTSWDEFACTVLLKMGGQVSGILLDWGGQVSSGSSWPPGHTEKNHCRRLEGGGKERSPLLVAPPRRARSTYRCWWCGRESCREPGVRTGRPGVIMTDRPLFKHI